MAKRKTTEVAQRAKARAVADLLEAEGYHRQSAESAAMSEIRRRFRSAMNAPETGGRIADLDVAELASAVKEKHAARIGKPAERAKRAVPKGAPKGTTGLEEALTKSITAAKTHKGTQSVTKDKAPAVVSPKSAPPAPKVVPGPSPEAISGLKKAGGGALAAIPPPAQGAEMLQELTAATPEAIQSVRTSGLELARPPPVRTPAPFPELPPNAGPFG